MAEFDRESMLNRLDDFKASVTQAESSIKSLLAELEVTRKAHEHSIRLAKSDLDKAKLDLKTIPVRSAIAAELLRLNAEEAEAHYQQVLKEVKFMEDSLKAQLRVAQLTRDEARVELKRVEADVNRMLIQAPIDGLAVMQTTFRGGELGQIQEGDEVRSGEPFMQIVDLGSMVVNATANQVDSELIRIGAKARVRFDAYPNLELPARVYAIGAMTKPAGWRGDYVKEVPVTLRLEETDPRVIPDLSVSVDIVLASETQGVIAPLESIFRDGPDGRPFLFVQRASGWEQRDIELGLVNHVAAVVRSGLSEGNVIALRRPTTKAKE